MVAAGPFNGGWQEKEFLAQIVSVQRETKPWTEAIRIKWPGPMDFARCDEKLIARCPGSGNGYHGIRDGGGRVRNREGRKNLTSTKTTLQW